MSDVCSERIHTNIFMNCIGAQKFFEYINCKVFLYFWSVFAFWQASKYIAARHIVLDGQVISMAVIEVLTLHNAYMSLVNI